jgi:hypothetical protein
MRDPAASRRQSLCAPAGGKTTKLKEKAISSSLFIPSLGVLIGLGLAQAEANLFATFESLAQGPMSHSEGKTVFTKESAASAEEAVARAATEAELSAQPAQIIQCLY